MDAQRALIETHGDLFHARVKIGISALHLDGLIRCSPRLQETIKAITDEQAKGDYDGRSEKLFANAIQRRLKLYRVEGLDALHELATMPIDEKNSANNQVKFAAAAKLSDAGVPQGVAGETSEIMRALNESYQQHAPRLRVIRERVTVETMPGEKDVTPG